MMDHDGPEMQSSKLCGCWQARKGEVAAEKARLEEASRPLMLEAMWAANLIDIQSTVRHVCRQVRTSPPWCVAGRAGSVRPAPTHDRSCAGGADPVDCVEAIRCPCNPGRPGVCAHLELDACSSAGQPVCGAARSSVQASLLRAL